MDVSGVERDPAVARRGLADRLDIVLRMDARDRGIVGERRNVARQRLKRLALERAFDRAHAVGPLGMALAHVVLEAGGVRDEERRSAFGVLAWRFPFSRD